MYILDAVMTKYLCYVLSIDLCAPHGVEQTTSGIIPRQTTCLFRIPNCHRPICWLDIFSYMCLPFVVAKATVLDYIVFVEIGGGGRCSSACVDGFLELLPLYVEFLPLVEYARIAIDSGEGATAQRAAGAKVSPLEGRTVFGVYCRFKPVINNASALEGSMKLGCIGLLAFISSHTLFHSADAFHIIVAPKMMIVGMLTTRIAQDLSQVLWRYSINEHTITI